MWCDLWSANLHASDERFKVTRRAELYLRVGRLPTDKVLDALRHRRRGLACAPERVEGVRGAQHRGVRRFWDKTEPEACSPGSRSRSMVPGRCRLRRVAARVLLQRGGGWFVFAVVAVLGFRAGDRRVVVVAAALGRRSRPWFAVSGRRGGRGPSRLWWLGRSGAGRGGCGRGVGGRPWRRSAACR